MCHRTGGHLVPGRPHVEHDVADEIVVEREGCLVRKVCHEPDKAPHHLEHLVLALPGQLLHEVFQEEV